MVSYLDINEFEIKNPKIFFWIFIRIMYVFNYKIM